MQCFGLAHIRAPMHTHTDTEAWPNIHKQLVNWQSPRSQCSTMNYAKMTGLTYIVSSCDVCCQPYIDNGRRWDMGGKRIDRQQDRTPVPPPPWHSQLSGQEGGASCAGAAGSSALSTPILPSHLCPISCRLCLCIYATAATLPATHPPDHPVLDFGLSASAQNMLQSSSRMGS